MNNAEKLEWTISGDTGKYEKVKVGDLRLDHSYQRGEYSENNTRTMARNFNWTAFGTLVAMRRNNGAIYVVDGQQRLLAAKCRGDIKSVPCRVFKSKGKEHEAKAFIALNVNRKNVSSVHKFRAAVMSGQQPEHEINVWLGSQNLHVTTDGTSPNGCSFASILTYTWSIDKEACKAAIEAQVLINAGMHALHGSCHKGLWWLIHNGVDVQKNLEKIISKGGRSAMLREINSFCLETFSPKSTRSCGYGILRVINYKRKNKIRVNEDKEED